MSTEIQTSCAEQVQSVPALNEPPPAVDAVIHISISDGGLQSCVTIEPPCNGGAAPTLNELESALANCGVSYHVDVEKLKELAAEPVYDSAVIVARGTAPVNGIDGTATFQFELEKESLKPRENDDGIVNYHDLDLVENVVKGQVLCVITPPSDGTPGISVRGKELPQKKGKPVPSYLGKNSELNESGTAILAKIDGQVDFVGRRINVNETFYVKENVDNSTGDITVSGNLVVRGMVMPGFKLTAGKNIDVYGTVESAALKAGGSVRLLSGITGSELACGGDLKSRFIENCSVIVKGDIRAEYVLNSNINCGKNFKAEGAIAKILGGRCLVGQNIEARTIGSAANIKTILELGTDPIIIERQQKLQAQVPDLEKQIESLRPLISLLHELESNDRLTPEKKEILSDITVNFDTSTQLLEEAKKELKIIAQAIFNRGYGRVICAGTIFPGTKVTIGTANYSVTDALMNASLFYQDGTICLGSAR